ncbi:MAG: HutD family protein [Rubrivivax sp.]|nr:HutD family protein [Rubrivivax sp.]
MTMHHARLSQAAEQPWRNGGGTTRVLLTWPDELHWRLRVSVATISADGPFSPFPGVERWFAVIEGAGVRLALPEGTAVLQPGDAPRRFDGEAAPGCTLLDGATQDLNLMARRDAGRAGMAAAMPGSELGTGFAWRGLYAADAATLEIGGPGGPVEPLAAGTLLWSDAADDAAWTLRQGRRAWWLWLEHA